MIGGPLDPENVKRVAPELTPAAARFLLEACIERGSALDADTVLLLREIARRDKPAWEPRSAVSIRAARLESRGITPPAPRKPEDVVEVSELDLGEEKAL